MNKQILYLLVLLIIGYVNAGCLTNDGCRQQCKSVCPSSGKFKGKRPVDGYCDWFTCNCVYATYSPSCSN